MARNRPKWRRNGKQLFYLDANRKLVAIQVRTGATFEHFGAQPLFATGILTRDARFDVTADGQRFLIPTVMSGGDSVPATVVINWMKAIKP